MSIMVGSTVIGMGELITEKFESGEVTGKLVNIDQIKNGELYRKLDDELAVVVQVVLHDADEKRATVTMRRDMFEFVDEEEFIEKALEKAKRYDKISLKPMSDVLNPMMNELFGDDLELPQIEDCGMYILTNRGATNGAAAITYPGIMEAIAVRMAGSYWAIPSSIHEWLIVKDDGSTDYRELNNMIHDINLTLVRPDEVLAWKCRHYDIKTRTWELGEEYAKRVGRA